MRETRPRFAAARSRRCTSRATAFCILGGRGVCFRGAAARYLGLLAATLGRSDDAARHPESALSRLRTE